MTIEIMGWIVTGLIFFPTVFWVGKKLLARFGTEKIQYQIILQDKIIKTRFKDFDSTEMDLMIHAFQNTKDIDYIDLVDDKGDNIFLPNDIFKHGYLKIKTKMRLF